MRSPILLFHIIAGILGMLSGFVAVFLRKRSRSHGLAGNVFVIAMLTLSSSGVFLAVMKSQPGNILGGTLTFYLVATAWMVARREDGKTNALDWGALLVVLALAIVELSFGFEAATSATKLKYGYPAEPYFFMGSVASLATVGDARMLLRGGISGTRRVARHLWRMCFALFIASSSIFLARQHLFPAILRKTGVLIFLSVLPLGLLIFWIIRVRFTKAFQRTMMTRGKDEYCVQASPATFAPVETHSGVTIERQLGARAL